MPADHALRADGYRISSGDVRIYYDVTEDTVEVLAIIDKSEAGHWLARAGETQ